MRITKKSTAGSSSPTSVVITPSCSSSSTLLPAIPTPRKQQRQRSSSSYYSSCYYPFLLLSLGLTGFALNRNGATYSSYSNILATSYNQHGPSLNRRETTEVPGFSSSSVVAVDTNQQQPPKEGQDSSRNNNAALLEQLKAEEPWDTDSLKQQPEIVWLASYPNSGTSYTMTLVERATNLSTASNYGAEVTHGRDDSEPVYPEHPEGPFWEGLSGKLGYTVRPLPAAGQAVLVKTHCGGRCVKCAAADYAVDLANFTAACQRTTGYRRGERVERSVPATAVAGVVHLLRHPLHNVVARFHLERRNMVEKRGDGLEFRYPVNATGFARWCLDLDLEYGAADADVFDAETLRLFEGVPCHAEFYKWTQWHNRVAEMVPHLGNAEGGGGARLLTVHYEDYARDLAATARRIAVDFLRQPLVASGELRPFRNLPRYERDHFSRAERRAIARLVRHVATDATWPLVAHYFSDDDDDTKATANAQ